MSLVLRVPPLRRSAVCEVTRAGTGMVHCRIFHNIRARAHQEISISETHDRSEIASCRFKDGILLVESILRFSPLFIDLLLDT